MPDGLGMPLTGIIKGILISRALKRRGAINHGSTLEFRFGFGVVL